jgi:hypothetical protein
LAAKAKQLTRKLLEETTVLFTPETVLGWYRKLIAQKYDGSKNCSNPGRPRMSQEITELVLRFKRENLHWGYTRILVQLTGSCNPEFMFRSPETGSPKGFRAIRQSAC